MAGTKSYRLLSEAEFEYAARAGSTTKYPWGDDIGENNSNCDGCKSEWDGKKPAAPVSYFAANAFGLFDMQGNVWQWVEDCWHENYEGAPKNGAAENGLHRR
jgi:formylglycine-generating enzyme required for sulfatase activity